MKRRPLASRITEPIAPAASADSPETPNTPTNNRYSVPLRLKRGRRVSYAPDQLPREETPDAPRLFVRGFGGSIKIDPRGMGTQLSSAAFAHYVSDDSLVSIHIHQGDIVLIESAYRAFRAGNLVLLEIDGHAVLRRLTKKKQIWYLNLPGEAGPAPVPLIDQPLQGVAVGIVRMFAPLKPVKFRTTDANCEVSFMRSGYEAETNKKRRVAVGTRSICKAKRRKGTQPLTMLAAEKKAKFRLSEIDKSCDYTAWPNTR